MQLNSGSDPFEWLTSRYKMVLLETWFRGASTVLTAGLATLHKDRFIERQPDNSATTRLEWDGLGLLIRSF